MQLIDFFLHGNAHFGEKRLHQFSYIIHNVAKGCLLSVKIDRTGLCDADKKLFGASLYLDQIVSGVGFHGRLFFLSCKRMGPYRTGKRWHEGRAGTSSERWF